MQNVLVTVRNNSRSVFAVHNQHICSYEYHPPNYCVTNHYLDLPNFCLETLPICIDAITLRPLEEAKKQGFNDNLYLDLETYKEGNLNEAIIQELSAANVFLVLKTGEIVTPCLKKGTTPCPYG